MRRFWLILTILTTLSIVASPMFPISKLSLPSIPKAHATTRSIVLVGNYAYGWNSSNPPITVTQGDSVTVTLSSGDGVMHSFVVDVDKDMPVFSSTGCPPLPDSDKCSGPFTAPTTSPITYQITVDFNPGTYVYYCSFHTTSMVGNFIVQPLPGPDFGISSNPPSLTILQGSKANSTITATSLNNFAGSVTLSSSPSSPTGLMTSSFSVNPVMVPAGGTAKSNFTISVPVGTSPGSYSLTVTGSNSTTSRNTSVSVTVTAPDFTIISSPSSLNIPQGSSGTTTITLTSLNGFSGTVSLTSTLSSSGPQVTFSPASVAVPSGGSISSTLSVSAASSGAYSTAVSQGTYTVTVTGTSGSSVHSTTLSLTVGSSSGVGGLPGTAIIGGGIAAAIAVVAAIVYVLRRRPKTSP
jgi:plastocyanin